MADDDDRADKIMLCNGLEEAFVGLAQRREKSGVRRFAVYDIDKGIEILVRDGMSRGEAINYLESYTLDVYVGRGTPCFISTMPLEDAVDRIGSFLAKIGGDASEVFS